ncbi:MAG TPA: hypothetical protein DCF87_06745 [Opitutae bacterium]|nr:hypothetical protein [Opitutae bacterium]
MIIFSEKQKKFLGFVSCSAGVVLLGALLTLIVYLLNLAFDLFGGVFWSLAISAMLAILLRPVIYFFEEKLKLKRIQAILALYLIVLLFLSSIFWFFGGKFLHQTKEIAGSVREWPTLLEEKAEDKLPADLWQGISSHIDAFKEYWTGLVGKRDHSEFQKLTLSQQKILSGLSPDDLDVWSEFDPSEKSAFLALENNQSRLDFFDRKKLEMQNRVVESIGNQSERLAQKSAEVLKSAWSAIIDLFAKITYLAVIPIYLFYFLGTNRNLIDDLEKELSFLSQSIREDLIFLLKEFVGIMVAFFRGQLLIGMIMGIGYAIGFSISGLKFGITLGIFFGLLNVVPYLGSIIGISTALVLAYLQPGGIADGGGFGILIGCGITFSVVQLFESYFLTPKIMGEQTGLHPVVVIVSIFFWGTALGGILGMIFGIPLTAFLIILWRLLCKKYFRSAIC